MDPELAKRNNAFSFDKFGIRHVDDSKWRQTIVKTDSTEDLHVVDDSALDVVDVLST